MCLEALDYPSIKWLHKRCQIQFEEFKLNILWLVNNEMSQKIVENEADMTILIPHLDVQLFNVPVVQV